MRIWSHSAKHETTHSNKSWLWQRGSCLGRSVVAMASDEEPAITPAQLLKAVVEGAVDEVKKMLDPGLSESHKKFNATNPVLTCKDPKTGFPPLMLAAINGRAKMCEVLIVKKAALDCADERGDSPLHRAAVQSDLPVIEALIARGMPVDVRSKSGLTPLHHAATRGDTGVSDLLLTLGASPNVQDDVFGSTPLHFAAIEVRAPAAVFFGPAVAWRSPQCACCALLTGRVILR